MFNTKWGRRLLQRRAAFDITKWGRNYYKVGQLIYYKVGQNYYKVGLVLQSRASLLPSRASITK